ncbi:MAG TPA: hypothetical protein VMG12_36630 [Polyangiaceae bacterium]|nr:hypothetical protein [Polyangiaceae bacterium]
MSSNYAGSGTTIHTSSPMLDDGDAPAAILWRIPEEKIFDSLAAIATALGGTNLTWTALTTAGGTKNIAANLLLQGVGEIRFGTVARVVSGATLLVDSGAAAFFNGDSTFNASVFIGFGCAIQNGATLAALSGSTVSVQSGAQLTVSSGGLAVFASGSEARMTTASTLTINAAAFTGHVCMTPIAVPSGWSFGVSGSTMGWDMAGASGEKILFALPFKPGDSLLTVTMRLEGDAAGGGGHAGLPADMPLIEVLRKDVTTGVFTIVDSQVDGVASSPSVTNAATYDAAHDVTISFGPGHSYVANAVYYVRITAEGGANADAGSTRVYSIKFTGLARSYRSSVEAYQ